MATKVATKAKFELVVRCGGWETVGVYATLAGAVKSAEVHGPGFYRVIPRPLELMSFGYDLIVNDDVSHELVKC